MSKPKSISDEEEVPRIDESQFLLSGEIDPEFPHLIHFQGSLFCFVCKSQTTYEVDGGAVSADTFSDDHIHKDQSKSAITEMPNRLRSQIITETSPDESQVEKVYKPERGEEIVKPDLGDDDEPEPPSKGLDGDVSEVIKF
jgi:hypothetical protein